jgi:Domain of unknown function (DUF4129)
VLRPRFVPLAVLVTLLVAVVALVARGRPLGSGGGRGGLPLSFWDYVYTTGVILGVPILLAMGLAAMFVRGRRRKRRITREYVLRSLILFALLLLFEFLVVRHLHLHFHGRLQPQTVPTGPLPVVTSPNGRHTASSRSLHFRWDELAVVLGVLFIVAVVVAIVVAKARAGPESRREIAPEALAAALDESLDDLRADPDLRRAIIAAYARMETALGAAGIPRSPAEAPLEYVERALLSLDTSAPAVRSLTDLFEWARFSQHEPEPSMRDDAVDALIAVRDELRASELTPA